VPDNRQLPLLSLEKKKKGEQVRGSSSTKPDINAEYQKDTIMTQNRKPRGKGKRSILVEETAMKLGCDPFKILCLFANGDWQALGYDSSVIICEKEEGNGKGSFIKYVISPELRAQCAKDACKYLYSQKQAVEVSGELGLKIIVEDYLSKDM
jgi:hypothetical protein